MHLIFIKKTHKKTPKKNQTGANMSESIAIKSEINNNLNTYLNKFNITAPKIIHNPSYEALFTLETDQNLPDTEKTKLTELNAVTIDTGKYTGRSPNDKYIVKHPISENNVWWKNKEQNEKLLSKRQQRLIGSTCVSKPNNTQRKKTSLS